MRNPDRIPIILEKLKAIWEKHPDSRLGQLVWNGGPINQSLYYLEDDELIDGIESFYKEDINENKS